MRSSVFILALFLLGSLRLDAITLNGKVFDKVLENPIEGAVITMYFAQKKVTKTISGQDGSFSLKVKKNKVYEMMIIKEGFDETKVPLETTVARDASLPVFYVYLDKARLKLKGMVRRQPSGDLAANVPLILEDLVSGNLKRIYSNEAGCYEVELKPAANYQIQYANEAGDYHSSIVFVSTIGATDPRVINRNIELYPGNMEISSTIPSISGRLKKGRSFRKNKPDGASNGSLTVVDKALIPVKWTKKKQRERTDNIPTVYFYAEQPPTDTREEKRIITEQIIKDESSVTDDPIQEVKEDVVADVIEQEIMKEEMAKEISVAEEQTEDVHSLDHEKEGLDFAEQMKGQLQMPKDPKPATTEPVSAPFKGKRNTVYFKKGKSKIADAYQVFLDEMAEKMTANKNMNILLIAHSDNDAEYKIENYLSKLRAEAVLDYLLEKGIDFDRMEIRIAGNKFPDNGCVYGVKCSEEEHRMNRRVEVKVKQNTPY